MKYITFFVLSLAALGCDTAAAAQEANGATPMPTSLRRQPFVPRHQQRKDLVSSRLRQSQNALTDKAILSVRGGATINHKVIAATTGASILSLYGTVATLLPDEVIKGYGIDTMPELTEMTKNFGLLFFTTAFVVWSQLYSNMSLDTAVGLSAIPYILRSAQNIFCHSPAMLFGSCITEYIGLVVSSLVAYANLTESALSNMAMKAFGTMLVLPGIAGFLKPKNAGASPGKKGKHQTKKQAGILTLLNKNYGNDMLFIGVFYTAIANGYSIFQAFAACFFVGGTGMGYMAIKDMPKYEPKLVGPTIAWMVLSFLMATGMTL